MTPIRVDAPVAINEVLERATQLPTPELEQLVLQIHSVLAQRRVPSLPKREAELLQQINRPLPPPVRRRYTALNEKLHDERLTEQEHQELLILIDEVELTNAERLRHLIELAQIRTISLDALMDQLGIQLPVYA